MPVPDFSPGEVLTAAAMDSIGMWHLNTTSFSGATQVDFTNVFTSAYDSYRVEFHFWTATVSENHFFRLRDSGGILIGTNYLTQRLEQSGATVTGVNVGGGLSTTWFPSFIVQSSTAGAGVSGYMDIYQPQKADYTRATGAICRTDSTSGATSVQFAGLYNLTTVLTGFSLVRNSTATMTGKVSVYGIRN
jgi:hypothetical protein